MSRSVHPYIDLYGYFSIHLYPWIYIYLSIYIFIYPIYPSIFISQLIYLSIYLSRNTTRCWCVWGGCVTPLEWKLNVSAANTIYPTWSRRNSRTAILNFCYLVIFIFTQEKYNYVLEKMRLPINILKSINQPFPLAQVNHSKNTHKPHWFINLWIKGLSVKEGLYPIHNGTL